MGSASSVSDKVRSLGQKWQTLIEANFTVKTTDDYLPRRFAIAFTKRRQNQIEKDNLRPELPNSSNPQYSHALAHQAVNPLKNSTHRLIASRCSIVPQTFASTQHIMDIWESQTSSDFPSSFKLSRKSD